MAKTSKPYTADKIYSVLCQDPADPVQNQVGDYESRQKAVIDMIHKYAVTGEKQKGETTMGVKISNCGHDENGRYAGGKAGDQTGTEYQIVDWYNRPWLCVLRFEDKKIADMIADMATKAARNDLIGYDQGTAGNSADRYTFWNHLKASNYDPAQITVACESDCSASTAAIVKGAGYRLNNAKLKNVSYTLSTFDMRDAFVAAGATLLTDKKYLESGDYIKAGDILLNDGHHVAIAVTSGTKASTSSTSGTTASDAEKKQNTVAYVARFTKACKCYTAADTSKQSKLFPLLKKDSVVDVMKYTETVNGKKWYFIRIPHPTEGFVFEFVPAGYFKKLI